MKALSLLIALYVCLSSGEKWTRYADIDPKFDFDYLNHNVNNNREQYNSPYYNKKLGGGGYSPIFLPPNLKLNWFNRPNAKIVVNKLWPPGFDYLNDEGKQTEDEGNNPLTPVDKQFLGNEILRNNGVQNHFSLNSRREFDDDADVLQGFKSNNYLYILNKTNSNPQGGQTITSTRTGWKPSHGSLLETRPGSHYWVNEGKHNIKESIWIQPQPVWDQQTQNPYNPLVIDQNSDFNPWYNPDQNQNECYILLDVIKDLRALLRNSNISEEEHNLKILFKIVKMFILNNNLQRASFSVIVREIGEILLNRDNDHNSLREDEIIWILQQFQNGDLKDLLIEINSNREPNLQVVVSKLARLLYRLKQALIQRKYSQESIKLVINRAVQWSVPLVGYYFEQECKIKTQQYIVQNLEVALNVNLESVKHVENVDELQINNGNQWGLGNLLVPGGLGNSRDLINQGNLGGLVSPGNLGYLGGLGQPGNQKNLGGSGSQGNFGGLDNPGNQINLGGLGSSGNQGYLGNLGSSGNQGYLSGLGGPENQGYLVGSGGPGNQKNLGELGDPESQANSGGLGNPGNHQNLGGLGSPGNQINLGGLGSPGNQEHLSSLGGSENQGNLGGLGNLGHPVLGGSSNQPNSRRQGQIDNPIFIEAIGG